MDPIKVTRKGRYKGPKSRFWDYFSDFIRLRDYIKYGRCISCGKRVRSYKELQAGHYMAAANCGFSLIFDEVNVNGECSYCNGFDPNHQVGYRTNLNIRYGAGTAEALEERYRDSHYKGKIMKEWSKQEYITKTEEYKKKIEALVEMTGFAPVSSTIDSSLSAKNI